ncbi:MAG: hypothetical protein GQ557_02440 [Mycoplasmataceae bacterium]|nr:hypothetical protein [Mycoplasmataceae bacterium]
MEKNNKEGKNGNDTIFLNINDISIFHPGDASFTENVEIVIKDVNGNQYCWSFNIGSHLLNDQQLNDIYIRLKQDQKFIEIVSSKFYGYHSEGKTQGFFAKKIFKKNGTKIRISNIKRELILRSENEIQNYRNEVIRIIPYLWKNEINISNNNVYLKQNSISESEKQGINLAWNSYRIFEKNMGKLDLTKKSEKFWRKYYNNQRPDAKNEIHKEESKPNLYVS